MNLTSELESNPVIKKLEESHLSGLEKAEEHHGQLCLTLSADSLPACAKLFRNDPDLNFNFLSDVTCVDRFPHEPRFEIVYRLRSIPKGDELQIVVRVPGAVARVESLVPLWPAANAFEREVHDLFGVDFQGHPNPARILLPEDWEGHPLRKDYPLEGYR